MSLTRKQQRRHVYYWKTIFSTVEDITRFHSYLSEELYESEGPS
jgi:hypothetical protein